MTDTPTINAESELVARLRDETSPKIRDEYMRRWDMIRAQVASGSTGSGPRDALESWLDAKDELLTDALAVIERLASAHESGWSAALAAVDAEIKQHIDNGTRIGELIDALKKLRGAQPPEKGERMREVDDAMVERGYAEARSWNGHSLVSRRAVKEILRAALAKEGTP